MLQAFTRTGGACVGWANATWPLARLRATTDKLTISIGLLGTYSFTPKQVLAIERYTIIPIFAWGIKVRHLSPDYPQSMIFWFLGNPNTLLRGIRGAGFRPSAAHSTVLDESLSEPEKARIAKAQQQLCSRGNAVRWSAIFVAVIIWNALLLIDFSRSTARIPTPGPFTLIALMFAFAFAVGTLNLPRLQRLVLKPGRNVGEIRSFLRLLSVVSGVLAIILFIRLASDEFAHGI